MADEDFNETPTDDFPEGEKRGGSTLVTLTIFGGGIFLLIVLLYFAY